VKRIIFIIVCFCFINREIDAEENEMVLSPQDMSIVANQYEQSLISMNLEVQDSALLACLNSILLTLQNKTEYKQEFRIKIIKSPEPNAYSLINGSIHIFTGLFSSIDNEAQLALLLAHEMAHLYKDHHIKREYELHNASRQALQSQLTSFIVLGIGLGNTGKIIQRAMSGFSKNLEYEADSLAILNTANAGYKTSESILFFDNIQKRFKRESITFDTVYTTHPELNKRLEYSKRIISALYKDTAIGIINGESYQNIIIPSLISSYFLQKMAFNFHEAINICNILCKSDKNSFNYYSLLKAEAFILKEGKENIDSAYSILTHIYSNDTSCPEVFRDLGYVFMKNSVTDSASNYLNRYLEKNPSAADRQFINYYINSIKKSADKLRSTKK